MIQECLDDAASGTRRVQSIVQDLRMFSHPETQDGPTDVNNAARTAANLARHRIKHHSILEVDLGEVEPVVADEGRVSQVVLNLLVNAADATDPVPADRRKVALTTSMVGDRVLVRVRDTGTGISPDIAHQVFDPFFTTKPPGAGSGLGLAICRHIVQMAGGTIDFTSRPGEGTEFRVLLPAMKVARATVPADRAPGSEPVAQGRRPRILLVDDEERFCRHMERLLARDFDVVAETSPRSAQRMLAAGRAFDLVLTDLMMGELSGSELYRWMVEHRPDLVERTVFITGAAASGPERAFLESVSNIVIEKPVDRRNIVMLLRRLAPARQAEVESPERRAGPRFACTDVEALITVGNDRLFARLVDYSVSGIRVTGLPGGPHAPDLERAGVLLSSTRRRGQVSGVLTLARLVPGASGRDACFRLDPADEPSRHTLSGWLAAESA